MFYSQHSEIPTLLHTVIVNNKKVFVSDRVCSKKKFKELTIVGNKYVYHSWPEKCKIVLVKKESHHNMFYVLIDV